MALLVAVGLVLAAICEDLSRATLAPNAWILWVGVILVVAPLTYRATALNISSLERISLVCLEGIALYVVRLMRDPNGFTLPDEFPHALNLQQIVSSHHLYHSNPLLAITAHFPGLEGATSAIAELTGMSSWGSGVLFILFCRLTLTLSLFCLFAAVSRSARTAALGTLLFAGNTNYLMWESQYAYESLSLPLMIMCLAAIAERHRSPQQGAIGAWGMVAAVTIVAIVPTHHLTSYLLAIILWLASLSRLRLPRRLLGGTLKLETGPPIWPFALLASSLIIAWLFVVSSQTVGYLSPEVTSAFTSTLKTLSGEGPTHELFASTSAGIGTTNSIAEEAVSFLEPLMLLCALPVGLWVLWKRRRVEPLVWIFSLSALLYFVVTVFRLVPSVWEISNRTGEFFFIGMAFVAGATAVRYLKRFWGHPMARVAVGIAVGLCVVGGTIAGWPAQSRLSHPVEVEAANHAEIPSESEAIGDWFATQPPGADISDDADSFTINLYGHHVAWGDYNYDADATLSDPTLDKFVVPQLRKAHIRYVVVDLRQRSQDNLDGLYFNLLPPAGSPDKLYKPSVVTKWAKYGAEIYDSGDVVVFDLDQKP